MTSRLVFHIGYPKTGTTTLQHRVFPHHPDIEYLGKTIPDYGYAREGLADAILELTTATEWRWSGGTHLKAIVDGAVASTQKPVVVVSSENLVHPASVSANVIAGRLAALFPDAEVLITLRSQLELLKSFYRNDGAFGAYLFLQTSEEEAAHVDLEPDQWMELIFRAPHKNILGILDFDSCIEHYERLFRPDRVHVALLEHMKDEPARYSERLARCLRIDETKFRDLLGKHRDNVGISDAEFQRRRNAQAGAPFSNLGGRPMERSPGEAEYAVEFNGIWKARVSERFADGNFRLSSRRALDLLQWGYPVAANG